MQRTRVRISLSALEDFICAIIDYMASSRIKEDTITKECPVHGLVEHRDFSSHLKNKSGKIRIKSFTTCYLCVNSNFQKTRKASKNTCLKFLGECCQECGYKKCQAALDFHHVNKDSKNIEIKILVGNRKISSPINRESNDPFIKKLIKELDKCIILCKNCHNANHSSLGKIKNREASHQHGQNKKLVFIEAMGGQCLICKNENVKSLQFHHICPEDKSYGLNVRAFKGSTEKLYLEALKCALLCSNCHMELETGLLPEIDFVKDPPLWNISLEEILLKTSNKNIRKTKCIDCKKSY